MSIFGLESKEQHNGESISFQSIKNKTRAALKRMERGRPNGGIEHMGSGVGLRTGSSLGKRS